MGTIVLVHGSWHGSWCWDKVAFLLQDAGHDTIALDLPGRAGDPRSVEQLTLHRYAERVCHVASLQSEPVTLVGHSMAGVIISQAAEHRPHLFKGLVYLAAFLPANGQSVISIAQGEGTGLVLPNLVPDTPSPGYLWFREQAPFREIFYHDCSALDVRRAIGMLVPEPSKPSLEPVQLSDDAFGSVSRAYVECLQDAAIPIGLQRKMHQATPCSRVLALDTSHSPFLSAPRAVADAIISAAAQDA